MAVKYCCQEKPLTKKKPENARRLWFHLETIVHAEFDR